MIDHSTIERILDAAQIADVVQEFVPLKKRGVNLLGLCPFHNEKTASFFISQTRQNFYCFGCGEKGDIFSFVEKFEGLDFKGALETLANRAGVELKDFRKEEKGVKDEKEKLQNLIEELKC